MSTKVGDQFLLPSLWPSETLLWLFFRSFLPCEKTRGRSERVGMLPGSFGYL